MKRPKILIVDDDADFCLSIRDEITAAYPGVDIQVVHSGAEGLRTFLRWKPDLLIVDILMPGVDGLELIREIGASKERHTAKILALSGLVNGIGSHALAAGASAFFRKESGVKELIGALPEYVPELREVRLAGGDRT